jgi:hypothetical protein
MWKINHGKSSLQESEKDMIQRKGKWPKNCLGILVLLVGAVILTIYLQRINMQPSGGDIWGHLYKSQVMYENLKQGNWYPLFDEK